MVIYRTYYTRIRINARSCDYSLASAIWECKVWWAVRWDGSKLSVRMKTLKVLPVMVIGMLGRNEVSIQDLLSLKLWCCSSGMLSPNPKIMYEWGARGSPLINTFFINSQWKISVWVWSRTHECVLCLDHELTRPTFRSSYDRPPKKAAPLSRAQWLRTCVLRNRNYSRLDYAEGFLLSCISAANQPYTAWTSQGLERTTRSDHEMFLHALTLVAAVGIGPREYVTRVSGCQGVVMKVFWFQHRLERSPALAAGAAFQGGLRIQSNVNLWLELK